MHISNINDARTHLSQLVNRALAGDDIVIARNHEPLVKLVPIERDLTPRQGGFWAGKIEMQGSWQDAKRAVQAIFDESTAESEAE